MRTCSLFSISEWRSLTFWKEVCWFEPRMLPSAMNGYPPRRVDHQDSWNQITNSSRQVVQKSVRQSLFCGRVYNPDDTNTSILFNKINTSEPLVFWSSWFDFTNPGRHPARMINGSCNMATSLVQSNMTILKPKTN